MARELSGLKCGRCHHALEAHDEGDCAVNKHESATGPECECLGYVDPKRLEWLVAYNIEGHNELFGPDTYANCIERYEALKLGWSEVWLVRIELGRIEELP